MANTKNKITFDSINYVGKDGRHLTLTIVDTPNPSDNTHSLECTLSTSGGPVNYYDTYCLVKVNGQQVFFSNGKSTCAGYKGWITNPDPNGIWYDAKDNSYTCAKKGYVATKTITVDHGKKKKKTIDIKFLVGIFYYVVKDCGGSFTLSEMEVEEENPPVITQNNPTNIKETTCTISASSNVKCTNWIYQIRRKTNGQWGDYGNPRNINTDGATKSVTVDVSELQPNSIYRFRFKAQNSKNIQGTSDTKTITTLAKSVLNSINGNTGTFIYNINLSSITSLKLNITCYNTNLYHRFEWRLPGLTLGKNLGKLRVGSNIVEIPVTNDLLNSFISLFDSSTSSLAGSVALVSYTNSSYSVVNKLGESTKSVNFVLDSTYFAPTLTYDRYKDSNSNSVAITGDDRYIIPTGGSVYSDIQILNVLATSKNGAKLVSISWGDGTRFNGVPIWDNASSWNSNIDFHAVSPGKNKIYIRALDSRGFSTTVDIYLLLYKEGEDMILQEQYQRWYNVLENIYTSKDGEGNYYINVINEQPKEFTETFYVDPYYDEPSTVTFTLSREANYLTAIIINGVELGYAEITARVNHPSLPNYTPPGDWDEVSISGLIDGDEIIITYDSTDYFDLYNVSIKDKVYYGGVYSDKCKVTLKNSAEEELASVSYDNHSYYSSGDEFTVPFGDVVMFYAQGEQGADIYLNNTIVASVDSSRGTMYAYTTVDGKNLEVSFGGDESVPEIYIEEIRESGSEDDVTGIGNLVDLTNTISDIPHGNEEDYYYEAATAIQNLEEQVASVSPRELVEAPTRSAIDTAIDALDNIVLFNINKGEPPTTSTVLKSIGKYDWRTLVANQKNSNYPLFNFGGKEGLWGIGDRNVITYCGGTVYDKNHKSVTYKDIITLGKTYYITEWE